MLRQPFRWGNQRAVAGAACSDDPCMVVDRRVSRKRARQTDRCVPANPLCRRDAPDRIADVIGNEQRTGAIDRDTHRPAKRIAVAVDEAGEHILGQPARAPFTNGTKTTL
jgi:hypothetical protein